MHQKATMNRLSQMSGRELLLHSKAFMRKYLEGRSIITNRDIYTLANNIINNIPINIYNCPEVRSALVVNIIDGVLHDYLEKLNSVSQKYQLGELMEWVKTDFYDELLKEYIDYYKKMVLHASCCTRFWRWIFCKRAAPAKPLQVSAKEQVVSLTMQPCHEFVDVDFSVPGEPAHPAGLPIV